jgi:hypothetical protein
MLNFVLQIFDFLMAALGVHTPAVALCPAFARVPSISFSRLLFETDRRPVTFPNRHR